MAPSQAPRVKLSQENKSCPPVPRRQTRSLLGLWQKSLMAQGFGSHCHSKLQHHEIMASVMVCLLEFLLLLKGSLKLLIMFFTQTQANSKTTHKNGPFTSQQLDESAICGDSVGRTAPALKEKKTC